METRIFVEYNKMFNCLNRTMQYGILFQFSYPEAFLISLNRTMQYGNTDTKYANIWMNDV